MTGHVFGINTILHTKDGSKIGNAIVTGREGYYWEITTDYGSKVKLTSEEIDEQFNVAWSHCSKEIDGLDCQEMQEMMSSDHKHRVDNIMSDVSNRFSVHAYSIINEDSPMYTHWSEGLKMIIVKDGVTLRLNSGEIEQLVKALPRTFGGAY